MLFDQLKRREFITLLGGAAVRGRSPRARSSASGCGASACFWGSGGRSGIQARNAAFLQGLQQLGWIDGRNVRIDYRWAAADAERYSQIAAELVALAPDVILAFGTRLVTAFATGDPHRADRVRECHRSGRRRLRRKLGAAGRQYHRICYLSNSALAENGWSCSRRSRRA